MAGTTVNVSIRMDAEIKTEAEDLFSELGLSLGAAINVFVRQAVRRGRIPFRVTLGKDRGRELSAAEAEPPERPQGRQEAGGSLGPQEHSSLEDFFARLDAG